MSSYGINVSIYSGTLLFRHSSVYQIPVPAEHVKLVTWSLSRQCFSPALGGGQLLCVERQLVKERDTGGDDDLERSVASRPALAPVHRVHRSLSGGGSVRGSSGGKQETLEE